MLLALAASGQPSYWFQQFQKQGNAKLAQEYFFQAGNGISITWTNPGPYVWINATGGGGVTTGLTTNICVVFCDATTNTLSFTNGLLVSINGLLPPSHCSSIILPGGGYLLTPSGGSLCLP